MNYKKSLTEKHQDLLKKLKEAYTKYEGERMDCELIEKIRGSMCKLPELLLLAIRDEKIPFVSYLAGYELNRR
jgi:hypothetical protein